MSVQMMGAVINCGPQDRTQYGVMLMLANNADDFGFCFPSQATLAANSRCDEKTVRLTLMELERRGWIHIARKVLNGKCNVYLLNLERLGVTVPGDARRSSVFTRLLKMSPGAMSPIFRPLHDPVLPGLETTPEALKRVVPAAPEPVETPVENAPESFFAPPELPGTEEFSGDDSQGGQRESDGSHRAFTPTSPGIACPPNRNNHQSLNHQEPPEELEPHPTLPGEGDLEWAETTTRGEAVEGKRSELACSPHLEAGWERMRLALQTDLYKAPDRVTRHFAEIRPGVSDYDACFRAWWLLGLESEVSLGGKTTITFRTRAADDLATAAGLVKYAARLRRIVRLYFPLPAAAEIEFQVRRREERTA